MTMAAPDFENNGAVGPDIGLLDQEGFDFGAYIRSILMFMWELQQDEDTFTLPQIEAFLFEADAFEKWASMDIRRTPVETWWVQQSLTDGTTTTTTTTTTVTTRSADTSVRAPPRPRRRNHATPRRSPGGGMITRPRGGWRNASARGARGRVSARKPR